MSNFTWIITDRRKQLITQAKEIPEYGRSGMSQILEEALADFVKKHSKSQNPQTRITLFETGLENAIPNLYEDKQAWNKFYSLIKKKEDYQELDKHINEILHLHNKTLERFR